MAVRLDIRPRIVLRDEPPATRRPRWRLPPLALPAAAYWALMAAATYFFAQLGPNPLDSIEPARAAEPAPPGAPAAPAPAPDLAPLAAHSSESAEPAPSSPSGADDEAEVAVAAPTPAAEAASGRGLARADEPEVPRPREPRAVRREEADAPALEPRRDEPGALSSFPEFTDSSRPAARDRASDGPRIDSLFERATDRPPAAEAPAAGPRPERGPARALPSCEAAVARNNEQLEIGGPRGPVDITREAYASILQNGSYLSGCSIPARTVFEICAAVKNGSAVGVTVVSSPADARLNACVRSAVSRLSFPSNPRLDVTHTRFDAVRR